MGTPDQTHKKRKHRTKPSKKRNKKTQEKMEESSATFSNDDGLQEAKGKS